MEARQGRDASGGSMRSTTARPHSGDALQVTKKFKRLDRKGIPRPDITLPCSLPQGHLAVKMNTDT